MFTGSVPVVSFEELLQEALSLSMEEPQDMEVLATSMANSIAIVLYTSGSTGVPKGNLIFFCHTKKNTMIHVNQ